ncbi:hypothetical protein DFH94DRAFT_207974 [Russula ochroleuca]|uniref:Uncharacterized protein n=1 Tax=Russula ochroleuca TaxID=152965 RepID=A0A9P5JZK2_9AGAM|nr:hypothetical protein DFH94DRAFT_207974 [Russula ochroleuca]
MSEPPLADGVAKIGDHALVKITWDLGARYLGASSSEFVRTRTTIPIPRIRGTFVDKDGLFVNVMDYIPGERLDHVWPCLSLDKLWVAFTLRRYIRQLRQIKDSHSSDPGSVAGPPQGLGGYMCLEIAKGAYYPDGHDKTNWQDLVGRLGNVGVLPVVVRVCFDGICGGKRCGA